MGREWCGVSLARLAALRDGLAAGAGAECSVGELARLRRRGEGASDAVAAAAAAAAAGPCGPPFAGAMVCAAPAAGFCAMVDALEARYADRDAASTWVWLDALCGPAAAAPAEAHPAAAADDARVQDQASNDAAEVGAAEADAEALAALQAQRAAAARFDERLVYLDAWDGAVALSRPAAAVPLLAVLGGDDPAEVMLATGEHARFAEALRRGDWHAVRALPPALGIAGNAAALCSRGDLHRASVRLGGLVRQRLLALAEDANSAASRADRVDRATLALHTGRLFAEAGDVASARAHICRALDLLGMACPGSSSSSSRGSNGPVAETEAGFSIAGHNSLELATAGASYRELAAVERDCGDFAGALKLLAHARTCMEAAPEPEPHPDLADVVLDVARVLRLRCDLDGALRSFHEVLALREEVLGSREHVAVAEAQREIVSIARAKGDLSGAAEQIQAVLDLHDRLGDSTSKARALRCRAGVLHDQSEFEAAVTVLEEAVALEVKLAGDRPTRGLADALRDLAAAQRDRGSLALGLQTLHRAQRVLELLHGTSQHHSVADVMLETARLQRWMGMFPQGSATLVDAQRIFAAVEVGSREHPKFAACLRETAKILRDKGDLDGAMVQLVDCLDIQEQAFGTREHTEVAFTLMATAQVQFARGTLRDCITTLEEVVRIRRAIYGTRRHPSVANALQGIAAALRDLGELEEATHQIHKVRHIRELVYGSDKHMTVMLAEVEEAKIEWISGDLEGALRRLRDAFGVQKKAFSTLKHWNVSATLEIEAQVLLDQNKPRTAVKHLTQALRLKEVVFGSRNHPVVALTLAELGAAECINGAVALGSRLIDDAQAILWGANHRPWPEAERRFQLASARRFRAERKFEQAEDAFVKSLSLTVARTGTVDGNLQAARVQFELGRALVEGNQLERGRLLLDKAFATRRDKMRVNGKPVPNTHPLLVEVRAARGRVRSVRNRLINSLVRNSAGGGTSA